MNPVYDAIFDCDHEQRHVPYKAPPQEGIPGGICLRRIRPIKNSIYKLIAPKTVDDHRTKQFSLFEKTEHSLLRSLQRPQFDISDVCRTDRKPVLTHLPAANIWRQLKRLRHLKRIKRTTNLHRYYLARLACNAIAAAPRISQQIAVIALAT